MTTSGITWTAIRQFCGIFCCPPCPSSITSKLAFQPPPPTYSIIIDGMDSSTKLRLRGTAMWQHTDREMSFIEPFRLRTRRRQQIACIYIRCCPSAEYTILFSHGNAVDIGQMAGFLVGLGLELRCNIVTYDYSGYGCSSGKASEANIYADIEAVWQCLGKRYGLSASKIILYGQSIGTVPTIDLASRYEVAGVILHSPLASGLRLVFPNTRRTCCLDSLTSIDKCERILSPVLVVHGTDDTIIGFKHGQLIYQNCPHTVEPLWVDGAGHNDIEFFPQYLTRILHFIRNELSST